VVIHPGDGCEYMLASYCRKLTDLVDSFIIEGALTIIMAFAGYALLPNYPSNTSFLSPEETAMAQWRLNRENDGVVDEVSESVFVGLKQALSDPKVVSRLSTLAQSSESIADLFHRTATARFHSDVRRRLDELYLLFPIDRQDAWIPSCRNTAAYRAPILPGVPVLDPELMALRTYRGALLPYRSSLRHLCCWSNHINDNIRDRAQIFRHVLAGYGIILRLSGNPAVGFVDYCAPEIEEGRDARTSDSCV
jgi:hypothetical protein